jgi:hypothetical protein
MAKMADAPITIMICYQIGTAKILKACLSSIKRHTNSALYRIKLMVNGDSEQFDADFAKTMFPDIDIQFVHIEDSVTSGVHGVMLDLGLKDIQTQYVMSLDSDCFPIAPGWLASLLEPHEKMLAGCTGILYPYAPPPSSLRVGSIEFRVRSQHCWYNTHVACQLVPRSIFDELDLTYRAGDDTGLTIPAAVRVAGGDVMGFKATRCPKAAAGMDEEFNRYVCLVFADRVYHHAGYTRESIFGDEKVMHDQFGWARQRVLAEEGAEFLLDDANSYRFKFDREEEVAEDKMTRLFGLRCHIKEHMREGG